MTKHPGKVVLWKTNLKLSYHKHTSHMNDIVNFIKKFVLLEGPSLARDFMENIFLQIFLKFLMYEFLMLFHRAMLNFSHQWYPHPGKSIKTWFFDVFLQRDAPQWLKKRKLRPKLIFVFRRQANTLRDNILVEKV